MELRPELMPPKLDPLLVARLTELAESIDGAARGVWEEDLAEFNRLAEVTVPFAVFQGVYGGDGHESFVRRVIYQRRLSPPPDVSVAEMAEVVSRMITADTDHKFYSELFMACCRHPSGTDLIYWPELVPELSQDREASAREIAELALRGLE